MANKRAIFVGDVTDLQQAPPPFGGVDILHVFLFNFILSFTISFRYARQRRMRRSSMALFEVWYVCVLFLIYFWILR